MGKRWAVASDPKILARIAEQERLRGIVAKPEVKMRSDSGSQPKPPSVATQRARKVAINNQDSRQDSVHYDEALNTLTIVLAGAELLSLNTSLRMHNAKQTQLKTTWLKRIQALMLTNLAVYDRWKVRQRDAFPLVVEEVYATGENNCLDVESVCSAFKPIIDALVRVQFIPDDTPEYIAQPIAYTYRQANKGIVMVLRPAPKPWGVILSSTMDVARHMPKL